MMMETNAALGTVVPHAPAMNFVTITSCCWSPLTSLVCLATIAVCITVVWFAIRNCLSLTRQTLSLQDARLVRSRLAISRYALCFFATVCLLVTVQSLLTLFWNLASVAAEAGTASRAMMGITLEPPYVLAMILTVLTGIHAAIGIAFELRNRTLNPDLRHQ